jgi:hypothetical protein
VERRAGRLQQGIAQAPGSAGRGWAAYGKSNPPSDDKAFLDGWMKARAAALTKARHAERL